MQYTGPEDRSSITSGLQPRRSRERCCPHWAKPRTAIQHELERLAGATGQRVADLIAIEQRGDPLPPFPLEWRRSKLDSVIRELSAHRYQVLSRSDVSAQLKRPRRLDGCLAVALLVLTAGLGLILYAIFYMATGEPVINLEVDTKNQVRVSGQVNAQVQQIVQNANIG